RGGDYGLGRWRWAVGRLHDARLGHVAPSRTLLHGQSHAAVLTEDSAVSVDLSAGAAAWHITRLMSLTSALPTIKAAILLTITAAACGPIIEQAGFPQRPDTTQPGDLLGPYDGHVTDGESDKPVTGALVVATWIFQRGVGLVGPDGAVQRETETDAEGAYSVP